MSLNDRQIARCQTCGTALAGREARAESEAFLSRSEQKFQEVQTPLTAELLVFGLERVALLRWQDGEEVDVLLNRAFQVATEHLDEAARRRHASLWLHSAMRSRSYERDNLVESYLALRGLDRPEHVTDWWKAAEAFHAQADEHEASQLALAAYLLARDKASERAVAAGALGVHAAVVAARRALASPAAPSRAPASLLRGRLRDTLEADYPVLTYSNEVVLDALETARELLDDLSHHLAPFLGENLVKIRLEELADNLLVLGRRMSFVIEPLDELESSSLDELDPSSPVEVPSGTSYAEALFKRLTERAVDKVVDDLLGPTKPLPSAPACSNIIAFEAARVAAELAQDPHGVAAAIAWRARDTCDCKAVAETLSLVRALPEDSRTHVTLDWISDALAVSADTDTDDPFSLAVAELMQHVNQRANAIAPRRR